MRLCFNSNLRYLAKQSTRNYSTSIVNMQQKSSSLPAALPRPPYESWRSSPPYANSHQQLQTYSQQDKLPHLPVPALDQTLKKLASSASFLAESESEKSEFLNKLNKFANDPISKTLQNRLESRANDKNTLNWIARWWDDAAYFSFRESIVINVSYYFGFDLPPVPSKENAQLYNAAAFARSCLDFRQRIATGELPPDMIGKNPICMEPYKWAFNACRIPAAESDYAVKIAENSKEGQHITVVHNNKYFHVPIVDGSGQILSENAIKQQLELVIKSSQGTQDKPVGIFTGIHRDTWASVRTRLLETSKDALESIEKSAFLICLDSCDTTGDNHKFIRNAWHGDGNNRWFDKPIQVIVDKSGRVSVQGEHSCMDGTPTATMCDVATKQIWKMYEQNQSTANVGASSPVQDAYALQFNGLDEEPMANALTGAVKEFNDHISNAEIRIADFEPYGSTVIKSLGFSPDAWVQMMMQLAYRLTFGTNVATYESAQVRKFILGRTETVRTCTPQSTAWTASMVNPNSNDSERQKLLKEAAGQHRTDMRAASDAQGIDRHLFGLKKCLNPDEKVPDIFNDPVFTRSGTWKMSTSQLYMEKACAYGWGHVVPDGFGIPYLIRADRIQFTVANAKGNKGVEFSDNITRAGKMMFELMSKQQEKSKL